METQQAAHPAPRTLAAFALNRLPSETRERLQTHLRSCASCSDFIARTPQIELQALLGSVERNRAEQSTPGERSRESTQGMHPPARANVSVGIGALKPAAATEAIPSALREQTKYRIVRLLGRGGMGSVYEARHERMDRRVAIKVINPELVDNPQAVERFNAEVQAVSKLDHANIARAYDAETFGSLQAIIMEFIEGQTLYDFLKARHRSGNPLTVTEACRLIRQALLGLQHAHERGIAHRDLKPQNLMLTRDKGIVKILDFGLAKLTSDRRGLTKSNITMGTYEYMAPEQALDAASAGIRADIYSLGCTLYYLLAGVLPFAHDTDVKLLLAHQNEIPRPLVELRPEVPQGLSDLVARMLAKDPADRPQTPAEAAQIFLLYAKGEIPAPATPAAAELAGAAGAEPGVEPALAALFSEIAHGTRPTTGHAEQKVSHRPSALETPLGEKQLAAVARRYWPVAAIASAALLGGIILFGGLFKVRMAEGTIALRVNAPNAEVSVDGQTITVQWGDDGKTAEITAPPGKHRVEVKKQGFVVSGTDVTLAEGGHEILNVALEGAAKPDTSQVAKSSSTADGVSPPTDSLAPAAAPEVGAAPKPPADPSNGVESGAIVAPTKPAGPAGGQFPLNQWVDVLRLVDTSGAMVVEGNWSRHGEEIAVEPSNESRVAIPLVVKGSYDLEVEFTRTSGNEDVATLLSIGSYPCALILSGWVGSASGLDQVNGLSGRDAGNPTTVRPGTLQNGRRYRLLVSVRIDAGDAASVDVSLDGKPYLPHWAGNPATLGQWPGRSVPNPSGLGFCSCRGRVTFHSARLKMISGSASLDPALVSENRSPDAAPAGDTPAESARLAGTTARDHDDAAPQSVRANPEHRTDPVQAHTVWTGDHGEKLTILERDKDKFKGILRVGDKVELSLSGKVASGRISWLAHDVIPIKGGRGNDCVGTVGKDSITFHLSFLAPVIVLRLQKDPP